MKGRICTVVHNILYLNKIGKSRSFSILDCTRTVSYTHLQIHRSDPDDLVGNVKYKITEYEKDGKVQKIALFCINLKRYYDTINDYSLILNHIVSYLYEQDIDALITSYQEEMDGRFRLLRSYSIPRHPRCEGKREYESVFLVSLGYNKGYDYLKNASEDLPDILKSLKEETRWM